MSWIGVDVGGTKTAAVRCDETGTVLDSCAVPTPAREGGQAMLAAVVDVVRTVDDGRTSAIGVGAAGVIADGVVVAASESFTDWVGVHIEDSLARALCVDVTALNDVNAFLAGELRWGAVRGERDVFALTLGTGVGGAFALDGRIWAGERGMAGEIGHTPGYGDRVCTCGQVGHLETRASGRSLEREYARATGWRLPASEVADRARSGDAHALAVFTDAARALGQAAVTAANLFDVLHVVVGGGVRGAWDLLGPQVDAWLAEVPSVSGQVVRVSPSSLGSYGVALGAAAAAMDGVAGESASRGGEQR